MRTAMIAAAAALSAACAPTQAPEPASSADPVAGPCDAAKAKGLIGQLVTVAVEAEARRLSGARSTRVLAPDSLATMDFRSDRLNLRTDAGNKLVSADCG